MGYQKAREQIAGLTENDLREIERRSIPSMMHLSDNLNHHDLTTVDGLHSQMANLNSYVGFVFVWSKVGNSYRLVRHVVYRHPQSI